MDELALRQLTWFPVDSRVSHLAWLESNSDTMTTDTYGRKCLESSDPLDHVGFSVKTYLESCELPGKTFAKVWSISDILSPFFNFEAAAVGAKHRRERIFFVGYAEHDGQSAEPKLRSHEASGDEWWKKEQSAPRKPEGTNRSIDASGLCGSEEGSKIMGDTKCGRCSGQPRRRSGKEPPNGHPRVEAEPGTVANTAGERRRETRTGERHKEPCGSSADVANTDGERRQRSENTGEIGRSGQVCEQLASGCYPVKTGGPTKPRLGGGLDGLSERLDGIRRSWLDGTWEVGIPRVATGVKNRADRIKALGNAVVPQQVYPILKAIADYEKARKEA